MEEVFIKSIGYIILIILGFCGKKIGIFHIEDRVVLSKVMLYITMPCIFIASFKNFTPTFSLIVMFVLAILSNLILCYVGLFFARKKEESVKALYMLNCSGSNVNGFAVPIIASIFSSGEIIAATMYGMGNAIMTTGGTYALAKYHTEKGNKPSFGIFFRSLFSSVPFDTCFVMLIISILNIHFPALVYEIADMIGSSTIIITMVMLGITFDIDMNVHDLGDILLIIAIRLLGGFIIATMACYLFCLSEMEKITLYIVSCGPVTSFAPNFCNKCGCKPSVYGVLSSVTVPISLVAINFLMLFV